MIPSRKYVLILVLLLVVSLLVTGCNGRGGINKDRLDAMINALVTETNEAIEKKDINKARDVWSKVTELSIKAKDYDDIAESLEQLSTNYVKLIAYLETGEAYLLRDFQKEFEISVEVLKENVHELTNNKK